MEWTDQEAVERVRTGDSDAFRVIVERHSRNLFRLAFRMTGNEPDAEDCVQETFLRAYRQIRAFDGRSSLGTWLYCIAANYSRDLIRMRQRRQERIQPPDAEAGDRIEALPAQGPLPDRVAWSGQIREILGPAMDRLSPLERSAFVLRHHEGKRLEEIGAILGIQPNAAKQSVFRAVQKLRRALQPAMGVR
ncbi:MAG: RNA polymerase sigma factor [Candidatus Solibacter usitatus]|nr:RNA polymerase sigma factor [Candidatus Solibacter usitatus]